MAGYGKSKGGGSDYKGSYRGGKAAKSALMIIIGGKKKKKGDDDDDYSDKEDRLADLKKRLKRRRR